MYRLGAVFCAFLQKSDVLLSKVLHCVCPAKSHISPHIILIIEGKITDDSQQIQDNHHWLLFRGRSGRIESQKSWWRQQGPTLQSILLLRLCFFKTPNYRSLVKFNHLTWTTYNITVNNNLYREQTLNILQHFDSNKKTIHFSFPFSLYISQWSNLRNICKHMLHWFSDLHSQE